MKMSIFICPVCSAELKSEEKAYRCMNNHTYDLSREGYVNLILANQKQSREPGDSKEMLEARKSFLNKGYYKPLARVAASLIIKYRRRSIIIPGGRRLTYCARRNLIHGSAMRRTTPEVLYRLHERSVETFHALNNSRETDRFAENNIPFFTILDAGCGEGYYTDYISRNNIIRESCEIYGIDISKDGIKSASKRNSNINFAVAGIYNLPLQDNSVDLILNIFAPFNGAEFDRVLKSNGVIITVTPGAHHLFEFKQNLYDDVYLNDEEFILPEKFHITESVRVKYNLEIHNSDDISNLLKMTPYYHKSPQEKIKLFLNTVHELTTTADFIIRILKKSD